MKLHTPKTLPYIPVAPGALPILGHFAKMKNNQVAFLEETQKKLGPLFWLNAGFGQWTVVVTGEAAHTVMKNKETRSDVMGGEGDRITGHITTDTVSIKDGAPHRRIRGAIQSPFTPKGLTVSEIGALLEETAEKRTSGWKENTKLEILHETSVYALDIIFRMLGVADLDLPLWRKTYNDFVGPWTMIPFNFPGSPRWRSLKARDWMDKEFQKMIDQARATGDTKTMLGAIVHGTDEEGQGLEPKELFANLRILGLAGHETTAATVAWMFIHMGATPELWEEIREEAVAADSPPTSPKDMERFPKIEALFREVLRLYPVINVLTPRRVEEPIEIYGVKIPKDTSVSASLLSLSRDANLYPNPETLSLERWTKQAHRPKPSEAVQFGGGPHFCLGYHLAVFEGVVYTTIAARRLASLGLQPVLQGEIPKPTYMPLTRPPAEAKILLKPNYKA
ncbi:MAG: cytochrome P450 [Myxococcales bacterium]|nr:cytochrome P450 [Myxococcales bacterium]MCB9641810.1 cytochrome P450 [Myxococcales bacterium]